MRKTLGWLLSLVVLIGTMGAAGFTAQAATAAGLTAATDATAATTTDIKDQILSIPGMSLIEEKPYPGYRFFVLNYEQPVDHRAPWKGTFKQRLTLLHKDVSRPTVFFTSGYNVNTNPRRSEPTTIVDGNQVSLEYRFFTLPARPGQLVQPGHLAGRQRPAPDLHRAEEGLQEELAGHGRQQGWHDGHLLRALLPP